jgi:hypothetical protein
MRARNAKNADDSSMNTSDLSSIDQGEALEILASLGKKYYKSVGMGKSLDIDKLRQLQGIHRITPKKYHQQEKTRLHYFCIILQCLIGDVDHTDHRIHSEHREISKSRISRPDAICHFPFKDKVSLLSFQPPYPTTKVKNDCHLPSCPSVT